MPVPVLRHYVAGSRVVDAVRVAGELVALGRTVALEPVPGRGDDVAAEFADVIAGVRTAGLATACELTVPVERLGRDGAVRVARNARAAGLGVVFAGLPAPPEDLPGAGVVVPAGEPGAEARCRELAAGHVRLVSGRGADADLAFVRCLNVLMAADGRPAVATTDLRLIAIAGERAAWNGRSPDSWEYVMPYGVRTVEQRRLAAAGLSVRVTVPSGRGALTPGALATVARSLAGRA